jgi:hypothetical protein
MNVLPSKLNETQWSTGVKLNCASVSHLILEANGGSSNGSRSRVFKQTLQDKPS